MIFYHKKNELVPGYAKQHTGVLAGLPSYWSETGFHDHTGKSVEAPENAAEIIAAHKAEKKLQKDKIAAETAAWQAKRAREDALTPLARLIKRAMMTYPSIFPTRLSVLSHCYLVGGNGVYWQNGRMTVMTGGGPIRDPDVMNYEGLDIEERMAHFSEVLVDRPDEPEDMKETRRGILASIRTKEEERIAKELAARQAVEANIDFIASTPNPEETLENDSHYGIAANVLVYGSGTHSRSNLWNTPPNAEQSFFGGALEVIDVVLRQDMDDEVRNNLVAGRQMLIDERIKYGGKMPKRSRKKSD